MFKCPVFLVSVADCCLLNTDPVLGVQTQTNESLCPVSPDKAPTNPRPSTGSRDSVWRENIWLETRRHHWQPVARDGGRGNTRGSLNGMLRLFHKYNLNVYPAGSLKYAVG